MMRRMLLGLFSAVAVCGAAAGKPPGLPVDPLSEGREVDPVTRDFYLPGPPTSARSASEAPSESGTHFPTVWSVLASVHEAILSHLTMPLGTVPTDDGQ
jgi:hypothetical protein